MFVRVYVCGYVERENERERERERKRERENEREKVCVYECVHAFLFFAYDENDMKNRNTVITNEQT